MTRALERLREAPLNFDPDTIASQPGRWQYDERLQLLPAEPPGRPSREGSWEMARRLMRSYEFADPSMVRAFYDPAVPLERRHMLLEVRFHGLRFRVGCRVAEVYERVEEIEGRDADLWGWSYRTLKGHFEEGEMHWQVLKWHDSGEVAFRIRAWSRRARDVNPIVRLGFRLFGRREQLRFYDSTCERMRLLTQEAIRPGATGEKVRSVSETVVARSAPDADRVGDVLARNVDGERGRDG